MASVQRSASPVETGESLTRFVFNSPPEVPGPIAGVGFTGSDMIFASVAYSRGGDDDARVTSARADG